MGKNKSWCVAVELDRLHAELAEAKARIAELEEALHVTLDEQEEEMARAERAEARIAELEAELASNKLVIDQLAHERNGAGAERDAMRGALAPFAHYADAKGGTLSGNMLQVLIGEMMERLPYPEHLEAINLFCRACQEARAALAPSPAGRK